MEILTKSMKKSTKPCKNWKIWGFWAWQSSAQDKKESMRSCLELRICHNQNMCLVKSDPDLKKEENNPRLPLTLVLKIHWSIYAAKKKQIFKFDEK